MPACSDEGRPPMSDVLASRFEQAAWVLARVRERCDCWTVARHPLLLRWLGGELSEADLQLYAGEHHHATVALAVATHSCAELTDGLLADELGRQARARERELSAWVALALATGWPRSAMWAFGDDPLAQTAAFGRAIAGEGSVAERLVSLYAFECAAATAAGRQLEAMRGRYGLRDPRCSAWLRVRADGDGPAAILQAALIGALPVHDPFVLVHRAERVARAYWELLDGIELAGRAAPVAG